MLKVAISNSAAENIVLQCGGALPARPPWPPRMRISLPRHDLLGEERWPGCFSQGEKGPEPLSPGAFIRFIRIGIQIKLINHYQAEMIK